MSGLTVEWSIDRADSWTDMRGRAVGCTGWWAGGRLIYEFCSDRRISLGLFRALCDKH